MPWRYLFVTGAAGPTHPAGKVFGTVLLAAGNALAWAQNFDAGKVVSTMTILVVGGVGVYVYALGKYTEARNKKFAAEQEVQNRAFAERKRIELELEKEAEDARRDSLTASLADLKEQLEKARATLHAQRNDANAAELRRAADMEELRGQLKMAVQASADAYDELHAARDQIKELTTQNKALIRQADEMGRQLADLKLMNEGLMRKLEGVKVQVDDNKAQIATQGAAVAQQAAQLSRITTPDPDAPAHA